MRHQAAEGVIVACPDARPPAYQAVVGLARAELLHSFRTAFYYDAEGLLAELGRRVAPARFARWQRTLVRRHDPEIPRRRVRSAWSYDLAIQLENRSAAGGRAMRGRIARWRTRRFDRGLARALARVRPGAALVFSDVGSQYALPRCRELGIPTILSMVHGDVREEQAVLAREEHAAPDFFRIYLGDGALDREELAWLHERRLRDLELADRILVPSHHIAETLARHGTPRDKIRVIPYAADTHRFRPDAAKRHGTTCTFLFAGGITQRKGIKYLLEAWRRVRRPGLRLQLLGPLPSDLGPLVDYLGEVEHLGRVAHAEMPSRMAAADVFVFPSLFEGSAVVTYEALACGLPSIVTPAAGSVVNDGIEGFVVPAGDVDRLAEVMSRLGEDPGLRGRMAVAARARAEAFDWPRYHAAVAEVARQLIR
ncbi:MAG: glycosyltransferase family 4 protein [Planctomycetaceae bacterium]|nr:glycosyltransferase family 4 protein [Planctomycetaceae bacterium]